MSRFWARVLVVLIVAFIVEGALTHYGLWRDTRAVCAASQKQYDRDKRRWEAIGTRIVVATKASPAATPEQRKNAQDFADFLNGLNGPRPKC